MISCLMAWALVGAAQEPMTLHYEVRPVPKMDRTDLRVRLRFKSGAGETKILLPHDYYTIPDLHKYVEDLRAEDGSSVRKEADGRTLFVKPGRSGEVRLRYTMSYDPEDMYKASFAPSVGSSYFHVAGCQWQLQVGDKETQRRFRIDVKEIPSGWSLYSNLGPDPAKSDQLASYDDMITRILGGGPKESFHRFKAGPMPITVSLQGQFGIDRKTMLEQVEQIVRLQRAWFDDYEEPYYVVTITPRADVIAGTQVERAFVCFAKPDVSPDELKVLLAHEMLHTWLPSKMTVEPKAELFRYQWLHEGFTDYVARLMLYEAGLMTKEKFVELINKDIRNLADNPHRSAGIEEFRTAVKERRFGQDFMKLSYYRGALFAHNWDAAIRRAHPGKTLPMLIRDLYRAAKPTKGALSEEAFLEKVRGYGIDGKPVLERNVLKGEPFAVEETFVSGYALVEEEIPLFDLGFDLSKSREAKKIVGIRAGGPAEKAGLRDGMDFVSSSNTSRFSNAWVPDEPVQITVRESGAERTFSYLPYGERVRLRLVRPAPG